MFSININETKAHLSAILDRVQQGEIAVICKRNKPVAEIHPARTSSSRQRPIGLAKGQFHMPASFFDELPEGEVRLFEGENL